VASAWKPVTVRQLAEAASVDVPQILNQRVLLATEGNDIDQTY